MIPLLFEPTRPPRDHQWRAMAKARKKDAFAFLMEMGTGKSKVAVDEMCQLYLEGTIDQVLVVSGSGSFEDWRGKHLPENIPESVAVRAHLWDGGHSATEKRQLTYLMDGEHCLRVLIMNVEGLGSSETARTVATNFVRASRTLLIVDESTKIKNEDARRTIVCTRLGTYAVVRRILTGSAVTKSPMDLWGQMQFLGVEQDFGSNYYSFRARFCKTIDIKTGMGKPTPGKPAKSRTIKKITGYQNLDRLERLLDRHSFRVLKEECLDLPPKIYESYHVELTDQQRTLYRQMTKLATAEISGGVWSSAKNAMGRLAKLHQIILGHLVSEDGTVHGIETNRPQACADLFEEAGDKVIIWCAYRRDVTLVLEELARRFPDRHGVRYDGLVPPDDRTRNKIAFQDGDASWFVGTAATGGIGVTLTSSATTIYYSNSFNLEYRVQSEDRNHRDGQTRSVTYVDMISPGTVEERIVRVLREKKTMADAVMGDGVREWLEWMD